MNDINKEIAEAMKAKEREKLNVLKLIKTEFVKAEKGGKNLTEDVMINILLKMIDQRKESISQYLKGGRDDLAKNEQKEIDIIKTYVPEQPTDEEIEDYTNNVIDNFIAQNDSDYLFSMKDMKTIMSVVKEKYPTANGKIVSNVVKNRIN